MRDLLNPRILIVGPSRCGKDHAGEWLGHNTHLTYGGTCSEYLCPFVAEQLGINAVEAYESRHQHREMWYKIGNEVRAQLGNQYLLECCFERGDIAAGVRDADEMFLACETGMITDLLWISRNVPDDPTLMFDLNGCEIACMTSEHDVRLHVLVNNRGVKEYEEKLRQFYINLCNNEEPACA